MTRDQLQHKIALRILLERHDGDVSGIADDILSLIGAEVVKLADPEFMTFEIIDNVQTPKFNSIGTALRRLFGMEGATK